MLTKASAPGYTVGGRQLRNRLHRIEGQVRERIVDEDRHPIDVITQISAVQAALDKVAPSILDGHTRHRIAGHPTDEVTDEPVASVARLMRRG